MRGENGGRGIAALRDPVANRGTAFQPAERERLGLAGFLPPRVESPDEQVARCLANLRERPTPIDKYLYLAALQNENESLFHALLAGHLEELLPLVYTPTVGQACLEWSRRYFAPRGLYITPEDRGQIAAILRRWPQRNVAVIVVTDGGRILGLGDLGANGMGIPIGKLALYSACAGVASARCLPVTLDVGTDTRAVREDPFYIGRRTARLTGPAYDALVDEFVSATQAVFPGVIVQFEDFGNASAFDLLARHRDRLCCFNDDIQGTGAMALAGLYAAARVTGVPLARQRVLFVGAGQACLGIGTMLAAAMRDEGASDEQARECCLFIDSLGALTSTRTDLAPHKRAFAQARVLPDDLVAAIEEFRPTVLIGACGQGGRFTRPVIEAMARVAARPVVFALSNPTSKAECTAQDAYAWSAGRVLFASGSPFAPVTQGGRTHVPGQANNACVFPGVGQGLLVAGATRASDAMFLAAARALAADMSMADLRAGRLFPASSSLREAALTVATAVAGVAFDAGLATVPRPDDLRATIATVMAAP